jgi:hypothetical protein
MIAAAHVIPAFDLIKHDPTVDCPCIPRIELMSCEPVEIVAVSGEVIRTIPNQIVVHCSIDGRELAE